MPILVTLVAEGRGAPQPSVGIIQVVQPLIAGANNFGGGLAEDINTEITQHAYEVYLRETGRPLSAEEFRMGQRNVGIPRLFVYLFNQLEGETGPLTWLPGPLRNWIDNVNAQNQEIADFGEQVKVKVRAQWIADP
jgi:hypothetical protein